MRKTEKDRLENESSIHSLVSQRVIDACHMSRLILSLHFISSFTNDLSIHLPTHQA